jgi:hypothetical protein
MTAIEQFEQEHEAIIATLADMEPNDMERTVTSSLEPGDPNRQLLRQAVRRQWALREERERKESSNGP